MLSRARVYFEVCREPVLAVRCEIVFQVNKRVIYCLVWSFGQVGKCTTRAIYPKCFCLNLRFLLRYVKFGTPSLRLHVFFSRKVSISLKLTSSQARGHRRGLRVSDVHGPSPFLFCRANAHQTSPDGRAALNESIQCENRRFFAAVIWCVITEAFCEIETFDGGCRSLDSVWPSGPVV